MRKLFTVAATVVVLGLAGCSSDGENTPDESPTVTEVGAAIDATVRDCVRDADNSWNARVEIKNPTDKVTKYRVLATVTDKSHQVLSSKEETKDVEANGTTVFELKRVFVDTNKTGAMCPVGVYKVED